MYLLFCCVQTMYGGQMKGKRAFMLAETLASSFLWLTLLFVVFSMFASAVKLYAAADRRLRTEERAAAALACLASCGSPGGYAELRGSCTICGVTAVCYTVKEGDEESQLLWPDI